MKNFLSSIFNFKTILTCYIGAVGYGIGYNLPNKYNLHPIVCIICCLVLGTIFDKLAQRIVESKFFNKSIFNRIEVASAVYASYLAAWIVVDRILDYDLDQDFLISFYMILAIQVILLIYKSIKDAYKRKKEILLSQKTIEIKDNVLDDVQGGGTSIVQEPKDNVIIDNIEINGELRNREDPYYKDAKF